MTLLVTSVDDRDGRGLGDGATAVVSGAGVEETMPAAETVGTAPFRAQQDNVIIENTRQLLCS